VVKFVSNVKCNSSYCTIHLQAVNFLCCPPNIPHLHTVVFAYVRRLPTPRTSVQKKKVLLLLLVSFNNALSTAQIIYRHCNVIHTVQQDIIHFMKPTTCTYKFIDLISILSYMFRRTTAIFRETHHFSEL